MTESTHDLQFTADRVVKRFRSWDRGEADREWAALTALHQHAPGLAPQPLELRTGDGAPVIVMSRLPGEPLGTGALTRPQRAALSQALLALWSALPAAVLADLPQRRSGSAELRAALRSWSARPLPPVSPLAGQAVRAAMAWLGCEDAAAAAAPPADRALGQGDGNLANFLWDGTRCRIVDFEDSGISDPAYEAADLAEHVTAWLPGAVTADDLAGALGFSATRQARMLRYRRLLAVFWLLMLLPGNPGHHRNPPGSTDRQASRVLELLQLLPAPAVTRTRRARTRAAPKGWFTGPPGAQIACSRAS